MADKEGVVLFKQFDDKRAELLADLTTDSITAFVAANSVPLLTEFNQQVIKMTFIG